MWSFDDENENKNSFGENGSSENRENIYASYTDNTGNGGKKRPSGNKNIVLVVLLCIVVLGGTLFAGFKIGAAKNAVIPSEKGTTISTNAPEGISTTDQTTPAATAPAVTGVPSGATEGYVEIIAEKCLQSSVLIRTSLGSGSGVFYTSDGYILTNYHVVGAEAQNIEVTLYSGEKYEATYVYGDESLDVSVIKIDKNDCAAVEICSDPVKYGAQVIVIGNALGNGFTLTSGYVSAPEREVTISYETMTLIQIDAAINSGNSGGGLFNTAGQLIGLVNAKSSGTTSSGASIDNTGFAIPVSTILRCTNDLKEYGYVTGVARLGVNVQNYIELANGYKYGGFIVVSGISADGSAALSGIKEGDIIYAVNGETVDSFSTLKKMLTKYSIGDTVEIAVYRPTEEAKKATNPYYYLPNCEKLTLKLTFVEFNPNNISK
ncbi:MAG: S1C family serine protease [Eubacteriales bacterium]